MSVCLNCGIETNNIKFCSSKCYGKYYSGNRSPNHRPEVKIKLSKSKDSQKILWYYEIDTFDLGNDTYTPDFFIIKDDKFVEIKGYMSDYAQEKINKFIEQYPWNLDILYKEDLIKLGCNL